MTTTGELGLGRAAGSGLRVSGRLAGAVFSIVAATIALQAIAAGYFRLAFQFGYSGMSFRMPGLAPAQLHTMITGMIDSPQHLIVSLASIAGPSAFFSWTLFVVLDVFFGYRAWALLRSLALAWIPVLCALLQLVGAASTVTSLPDLPGRPWTGPWGIVAAGLVAAALYARPPQERRRTAAGA